MSLKYEVSYMIMLHFKMKLIFVFRLLQISASGPDRVVLRDVQKELAGKYRCEVSADAPNFHTQVVSTHMHVVREYELYV